MGCSDEAGRCRTLWSALLYPLTFCHMFLRYCGAAPSYLSYASRSSDTLKFQRTPQSRGTSHHHYIYRSDGSFRFFGFFVETPLFPIRFSHSFRPSLCI